VYCDGRSPSRPLYFICVPPHPKKTGGFQLHLFKKNSHLRKSSDGRQKNTEIIVNERPWPSFDLLFFYSIVSTNSFLQDCLVGPPRPGGKSISCLVYCRFSCCLILFTMAPVSSPSPPPAHVAFVPRRTRFFFPPNLFINKNDGPSCRFTLLRSSPMV
jgi:hypothetical protein